MRLGLLLTLLLVYSAAWSQTGPGGVGATTGNTTLRAWWRADAGVTSSGGAVSVWADQSGYGNDLVQSNAANRPTITTGSAALNGRNIIRYTGSSSQYFASSFSGPGVDNVTFFIVANGTSYQSLIRFQNSSLTYVVYPWEGSGNRYFISSSDGTASSGVATGLTNNVTNVGGARYRRNTVNGMQTYLNGGVFAQRNSVDASLPTQFLYSGRFSGGAEYPTADVGEMIVYYSALNEAQMIIVQNYLAAKYNAAMLSNDVYTMDNVANGNYDYDVAGIGQVNASNAHTDSRGTGVIRILNPTDLEDGEFLMWGSDNGALQATNTSDIPSGITARFDRVWRVSETGGDSNVGNIDIQLDATGIPDFAGLSPCDAALSLRLLVDTDNDGVFADQTPIGGATNIGGNIYRFANVSAIANATRFTFAFVNTSVDGPGGVGGTSGTTALTLWMDANKGVTRTGSDVTVWLDQSGTGRSAIAPAANARPLFASNVLNGFPAITFDGSDDILELSSNINTTTPTMFAVLNKLSVGAGYTTFLTLQNNLWLSRGDITDQWGMHNGADVLSGVTLTSTYRVLSAIERNFDNVDLVTDGTLTTAVNGIGFHGKALGTIGANNNGTNNGLEFFHGNIAELLVYSSNLNSAQRLLVENALAAKYGLPLAVSADLYTMDDPANGNFDYDVAGIARINSTNQHTDAKGQSIVRIYDASDLGDNEAFIWGHNNIPLTSASFIDVPSGVQSRLAREWGVSETGEVGSITIQFDLSGVYGSVTASDLRLLVDHDGDGIYNEAGTIAISGATAISCNNYVFTGVTALNNAMRFTLGTVNFSQTPLPVELVSFEGEAKEDYIRLTWKTESELNNNYFTVERLIAGNSFLAVGTVAGAGTSTTPVTYEFNDEFDFSGDQYYRLKQTDFDGKVNYSKVIRVRVEEDKSVGVFPNPVAIGKEISVRVQGMDMQERPHKVMLYDLVGRPVAVEYVQTQPDLLSVKPTGPVVPGMYILKINFSETRQTLVRRINFVE